MQILFCTSFKYDKFHLIATTRNKMKLVFNILALLSWKTLKKVYLFNHPNCNHPSLKVVMCFCNSKDGNNSILWRVLYCFQWLYHCCHSLSLIFLCCRMLSLVVSLVVTLYHLLYHLLSFVVTCCHTLSLDVQLVATHCTIRCHSLSFDFTLCTTRCHKLSYLVTRCTNLPFYKRFSETVKSSCFRNFRYTSSTVFS